MILSFCARYAALSSAFASTFCCQVDQHLSSFGIHPCQNHCYLAWRCSPGVYSYPLNSSDHSVSPFHHSISGPLLLRRSRRGPRHPIYHFLGWNYRFSLYLSLYLRLSCEKIFGRLIMKLFQECFRLFSNGHELKISLYLVGSC